MNEENNEIELNGVKYVRADSLLAKQDYDLIRIIDLANVMMVFSLNKVEDIIRVPVDGNYQRSDSKHLAFKRSCEDEDFTMDYNKVRCFTPNNTTISYAYIKFFQRILSGLCWKVKKYPLTVYEGWDETSNTFKKDFPVVFIYGKYCAMIAPRVDDK